MVNPWEKIINLKEMQIKQWRSIFFNKCTYIYKNNRNTQIFKSFQVWLPTMLVKALTDTTALRKLDTT